ncbi:MAG: hypothetical protein AAF108_07510 [Planctomycetota bacterium]
MRVAIVTCLNIPEPDVDELFMVEALRAAGATPSVVAWDDAGVDWASFDVAVVRSTWNYYLYQEPFRAWIGHVAERTRLLNPAGVLLGNMDKWYLSELKSAGVPVIPTAWVGRGEGADLASIASDRGWLDVGVVVKPSVSAGSWRTRRFEPGDLESGQAFLEELSSERGVMVQRFMPSVAQGGERAIVCVGGAVTHAVEKTPRFDGEEERVSGALDVSAEEKAFVARVLDAAVGEAAPEVAYARVDVIRDDDGSVRLSELELLEPSLFLKQSRAALTRFAETVVAAG